mgnify:CR=1 FL=1
MIELLIFHLHIIGALYAFTKNWREDNLKNGIMSILIIGLVFTIGWALTGPIARIIMPTSWESMYFNRDTLSLILLLIPEIFFFYHFFIKDNVEKTEVDNQI